MAHNLRPSEQELFQREIDALVHSHALHGSESLCKLLRYLADHALRDPSARLKEYQIATEVFGRGSDFDPQNDSMIRVQAGRLRTKLSEYYSTEGAHDPIIVELPKGSYHLQFRFRDEGASPAEVVAHHRATGPTPVQPLEPPATVNIWKPAAIALAMVTLVALAVIAVLVMNRRASSASASTAETAPPEFEQLWRPFLRASQEPWLVFSNAAFVGRPETGMRYYNGTRDAAGPVWDHYTGVGEVLAVHELDQVFASLHRQIRVKRGSLFSLDEVRNYDLIFLGSPSENLTLDEIPSTREFVFRRVADGPRKGDLAIVNVHPQGNEPTQFLASPYDSPLKEDYAVIGFKPGLDPGRSIIIFAGTTTFGTQGAVEYVSRRNSLHQLLSKVAGGTNGEVKPFEALVRVKVAHGVPVDEELVALRQ